MKIVGDKQHNYLISPFLGQQIRWTSDVYMKRAVGVLKRRYVESGMIPSKCGVTCRATTDVSTSASRLTRPLCSQSFTPVCMHAIPPHKLRHVVAFEVPASGKTGVGNHLCKVALAREPPDRLNKISIDTTRGRPRGSFLAMGSPRTSTGI